MTIETRMKLILKAWVVGGTLFLSGLQRDLKFSAIMLNVFKKPLSK